MQVLNPEKVQAIVCIDVDGTILRKEGDNHKWENESWLLLTAGFGASVETHQEIYGRYRKKITLHKKNDQILHDRMVKELITLWKNAWGPTITREVLAGACRMIQNQIAEEFKATVEELVSNRILVLIGTGGFELAAQAIAEALNLEKQFGKEADKYNLKYWFGNTQFIFDENDILIGFEHDKNIPARKATQATQKIHHIFKILNREVPVFAVSDGLSDFVLFASTYGIAFHASDENFILAAEAKTNDWKTVAKIILDHLDENSV
ncbi:hypothetical protein KKE34_00625 [Patescibacteria group bacterium]|nr:hypothetical protein [Patescibacteria group bacterium]